MAFVHLFNKLLALSIYHAGLRVRGFRLTHAERVALKELDPATSDGVTKEKGSEVYTLLHAQGWCADGALEDNNGNTVAMPTQTKCEELCNADPGCHYIAYGWVEQAGGYYRCASFGTCSSPTDYVQGSPSVFAKPLGRYTMLPTFSWCQDGPLTDNDGNAASIPTLSHCEAVCNSDPQCSFIAYGWATHHRGFFRCTTFSACSSPTVYLEGAVHVYEKPTRRYEVRKTDSWCMDGTLSDNNGRAASFPTQVSCEASCDLDPRCNFIVFGHRKKQQKATSSYSAGQRIMAVFSGAPRSRPATIPPSTWRVIRTSMQSRKTCRKWSPKRQYIASSFRRSLRSPKQNHQTRKMPRWSMRTFLQQCQVAPAVLHQRGQAGRGGALSRTRKRLTVRRALCCASKQHSTAGRATRAACWAPDLRKSGRS